MTFNNSCWGPGKTLTKFLMLLLLFAVFRAEAERPKVGLVLGGGGARGGAHIGVLRVLERERIPIDYIAGTSVGAIVGSLYASGHSPDEIESIINQIDWKEVLSDRGPRSEHSIASKKNDVEFAISLEAGFHDGKLHLPSGLIQGQRLQLLLNRLLIETSHIDNFDELQIPFRAVATDLATMKPYVFDGGHLPTAVRASMSVPVAFAPVRHDGTILVDGGIVDNVPADVAREMGADILIAVDVRTPLADVSEINSIAAVLDQIITGMMTADTDRQLEILTDQDILMFPKIDDVSSADFPHTVDAIPAGELAANNHVDDLRRLSLSEDEYAAHTAARAINLSTLPRISSLEVENDEGGQQNTVDALFGWQLNEPLAIDQLENSISELYSDGRYSTIEYKVDHELEDATLRFDLTDKFWGPTIIDAALRVSDNFDGISNYLFSAQATTHDINSRGAKWINRLRMGLRTGLFSELVQPITASHRNFVAVSGEYAARNVNIVTPQDRAVLRDQRAVLALDVGHAFGRLSEIRLGYELGYSSPNVVFGEQVSLSELDFTISQLTAEYFQDTLDHPAFPSDGLFLDAKVSYPLEALGADATATAWSFDLYKPLKLGQGALLLGLTAGGISNDNTVFLQEIYSLGGITRLSGYQPDELSGTHMGLASAVYYRRLGADNESLLSTPIYIGGSIETGNVWLLSDDISADTLLLAGSIFAGIDSPIGPIYLAYGQAEGGVNSIYLNIGSLFRRLPRR